MTYSIILTILLLLLSACIIEGTRVPFLIKKLFIKCHILFSRTANLQEWKVSINNKKFFLVKKLNVDQAFTQWSCKKNECNCVELLFWNFYSFSGEDIGYQLTEFEKLKIIDLLSEDFNERLDHTMA